MFLEVALSGGIECFTKRTCLMVQGIWHVEHSGCCSCLRIKECVRLMWPICNLVIATCSLLDSLKAGFYSPKIDLIWNSLLWIFLSQRCCYFLWRKLLIWGFESVYERLYLSGVKSKADLAAASALSFPLTPMWLGIQQKKISLFDIESSLHSSLMISEFSCFLLFNYNRTESESENEMNFSCFSLELMSSARSIAQDSAVNIELSIGRAFFMDYFFKNSCTCCFIIVFRAICKDI